MPHPWETVEQLLVDEAKEDLRAIGVVEPALAAFAGAALRFVAWVRPFPEGAHQEPLIELLALAAPLDCDRLMVSMGGRAWSLDEPAPVDRGGDHRQPVVLIHAVDGAADPLRAWSVLHPVDWTAGEPTLGPRWEPGPATGWISAALRTAVADRDRLRASWEEVGAQARRVVELGHRLYAPADVQALLGIGA